MTDTATKPIIDPATTMGAVRLTVADLDRQQAFYEQTIGLRTLRRDDHLAQLGVDGMPLVELVADPAAPPRPWPSTGLFHLALLVSDRVELARALQRVVASGRRLTGASDHLVSEALYLDDVEGNGIELYSDRPRSEWRSVDGQLQMATLPLDLDGLLDELVAEQPDAGMAPATRMGHVHLNVADLATSEAFYADLLGFEVTVRGYPGALFVSAGGYHHHLGLNTWAGPGAPPAPPGSRGLRAFTLLLPSAPALNDVAKRLQSANFPMDERDDGLHVVDPSGNAVVLSVAGD